jgi:hypothetical protein
MAKGEFGSEPLLWVQRPAPGIGRFLRLLLTLTIGNDDDAHITSLANQRSCSRLMEGGFASYSAAAGEQDL